MTPRTLSCAALSAAAIFLTTRGAFAERDAEIAYAQARGTMDADSAAEMYKRVIELFPGDTLSAWAMLRLAQYAEARGDQSDLEQYVIQLRERFPRTAARADAARLMPERSESAGVSPAPPAATPESPSASHLEAPRPAPLQGQTFGIQLGAFGVRANAMRMKDHVASVGNVTIVERRIAGRALFCVVAGAYATKEDAARALPSVAQRTGVEGVIVAR